MAEVQVVPSAPNLRSAFAGDSLHAGFARRERQDSRGRPQAEGLSLAAAHHCHDGNGVGRPILCCLCHRPEDHVGVVIAFIKVAPGLRLILRDPSP
jgi:hypothetical protein